MVFMISIKQVLEKKRNPERVSIPSQVLSKKTTIQPRIEVLC